MDRPVMPANTWTVKEPCRLVKSMLGSRTAGLHFGMKLTRLSSIRLDSWPMAGDGENYIRSKKCTDHPDIKILCGPSTLENA